MGPEQSLSRAEAEVHTQDRWKFKHRRNGIIFARLSFQFSSKNKDRNKKDMKRTLLKLEHIVTRELFTHW
jgi:hypothetical protein